MAELSNGPALIIGGGIGGLTAALALVQQGYPVRVFERAPALNEVGAGITLWRNATRVLDHLGLGEAIQQVSQVSGGGIIATSDGRVLVQMNQDARSLEAIGELRALHRADLQRALYDALPEGTVTLGARFTGYDQGDGHITAHFEGAPSATGSLLIGADGVGSELRRAVASPAKPRYSGYTCWRGICKTPEAWVSAPGEIWGVGDRFGVVPIGGGRLYWFAVATANQGVPSPANERKALLLKRFSEYAFQVPLIIEATPSDAIVHNDIVDHAPVRGWSQGRAVLLGDSAHATTPNMGQGAAMAMESAMILARCLRAADDLSAALAAYERVRAPRTSQITQTSWSVGKMAHWQNPVARWLRDSLFRFMPESIRVAQLASVSSYDAAHVAL